VGTSDFLTNDTWTFPGQGVGINMVRWSRAIDRFMDGEAPELRFKNRSARRAVPTRLIIFCWVSNRWHSSSSAKSIL